MGQTYEQLARKSVADLRGIAKELEHEAVKGHAQLSKEELVKAVCIAQDVRIPDHRKEPRVDRKAVKAKIQELKAKRREALEAKDATQLARARRRIQRLKRKLRAAAL